jgi:hypothetical protein
MKKLQQFFAVIVLTLALALSAPAYNGDILGPGAGAPPSLTTVTRDPETPDESATGEILTPGVTDLDPVTEAALYLLKGILSLF